jgi:hypothetical protein
VIRVRRVAVWCLRFAIGAAAGVILHYALYRMSMPLEPFIYQAF